MTALRRLACSSVLLSSDSSLLGKVVMRTNSLAAMVGRAATTNCRKSDTLWDATREHGRKHVVDRIYFASIKANGNECCGVLW